MNIIESTLRTDLEKKFGKVVRHGEWLMIPCPTCSKADQYKMKRYIHPNKLSSGCFICGIQQDVAFLLQSDYIPSNLSALSYEEEDEKEVDPRASELPYIKAIPVNQLSDSHPAIRFLKADWLDDLDTYANVHKIVYVPFEGGMIFHNGRKFITSAERLVFPVYFESKLVGWQMRSLPGTCYGDVEDPVRYYHLFNKGSYLYNYDLVRPQTRVVVVEGVKKALKFPNGVATWGSGISRNQLKLIQRWNEVVMMLDSDPGKNTQQRARGFVSTLNSGDTRAINIDLAKYGTKSPDELPSLELNQIVEKEWNEQTSNKRTIGTNRPRAGLG